MLFFVLIIVLVIFTYLYGTRTFYYWKIRGIKHDNPLPVFGNNLRQLLQKASVSMLATEMYFKYPNEKVVGFFRYTKPELIIRDVDIIKRILITDFIHFHSRGLNPHKTVIEPLLKNVFFADGDLWKLIRQRFSPAFSTSKLKVMFQIIVERAEKLQNLAEEISHKDFYDIRELMGRYNTDFIGACGFGIDMKSLDDENSQFRWLGKRIFTRTPTDVIRGFLKLMFPELCKHIHFLAPELEKSMTDIVQYTMKERNYKPVGKNDFMDLFLELKQKGKIVGESLEHRELDGSPKIIELEFNDMLLTAQMFVFFGAGFETSSSISSYTLHQLAFHPEWQEKVQQEIDDVMKRYNGKFTYEAVNEMKYLEMVFYESLRMYPPVGHLVRKCMSPKYTIPELGLTIDDGVRVVIPLQAIYKDKKYFANPGKFEPERFRDGRKEYKDLFLPFGDGPRACVGARLGQMQSMVGIAALLQKFTVEPANCSKLIPDPDPRGTLSEGFHGGLPLKLRKRT